MSLTNLKHIVVSEKNFQRLKDLGRAGDSFNDVITHILNKIDAGRPTKPRPASIEATDLRSERRHSSDTIS